MVGASYEAMESALRERLGEEAFAHCQAVSETAVLLATVYGVDSEQARAAGLLHDWDRDVDSGSLVRLAMDAGLDVAPVDRVVPYLLHARTGAAHVKRAFPELDEEVIHAIERHTVGHPEMSDLDKVVYIADMIAPGRRYPGVEELRSCAGSVSLSDLFGLCYQQSVGHLVRERKRLHPMTVEVWNALVAREQR
ncbi:MAG TPA: bis(5'-nucleosyl)-tetraphosphatase (symmetrical) YqeK [Coriobacteriia bacterium]|nr:bis(5'-nucleosyl)-tetraphosphatase (symmetrical) YqeK [Coriobacteriia bacterium]